MSPYVYNYVYALEGLYPCLYLHDIPSINSIRRNHFKFQWSHSNVSPLHHTPIRCDGRDLSEPSSPSHLIGWI